MRTLRLVKESLSELSAGELRAVAGAATGTCSAGCGHTLDLDCEDGFTCGCTELSERFCVSGLG